MNNIKPGILIGKTTQCNTNYLELKVLLVCFRVPTLHTLYTNEQSCSAPAPNKPPRHNMQQINAQVEIGSTFITNFFTQDKERVVVCMIHSLIHHKYRQLSFHARIVLFKRPIK